MKKLELIRLIDQVANVEYNEDDHDSIESLLYDYYINAELFTEEEIKLLININGYNVETFNDMLFCRYGYRDLEQMLSE